MDWTEVDGLDRNGLDWIRLDWSRLELICGTGLDSVREKWN